MNYQNRQVIYMVRAAVHRPTRAERVQYSLGRAVWYGYNVASAGPCGTAASCSIVSANPCGMGTVQASADPCGMGTITLRPALGGPCSMGTIQPQPSRMARVQSPLRPALGGPCGMGSFTERAVIWSPCWIFPVFSLTIVP
jgi:hypothetical protein